MCMQYTIRNIPVTIDEALRAEARREGKSLNEVTIAALARALGLGHGRPSYRSLNHYAGTWQDDQEFDAAIRDQDTVDEALWR